MIKEEKFRGQALENVAQMMCLAARTAPKARGLDYLEIAILKGDDIKKISSKMKEIGDRESHPTFLRDSGNILQAEIIVLIGTKSKAIGLKYCGFCGYPDCVAAEKAGVLCAYNAGDLGIAIGSAVALAGDFHVDNRLMYTIGKAAVEMELLGKDVKVAYGIPLSATGKNPFFDRK